MLTVCLAWAGHDDQATTDSSGRITFKIGCAVIHKVTIQLAPGHHDLQGIPPAPLLENPVHYHKAEGSLHKCGDGLHGDDESVSTSVSRVSLGILFPCVINLLSEQANKMGWLSNRCLTHRSP